MNRKKIYCPKCKSNHVKMIDYQGLELLPTDPVQCDSRLFSTFDCIDCGNQFPVEFDLVPDFDPLGPDENIGH